MLDENNKTNTLKSEQNFKEIINKEMKEIIDKNNNYIGSSNRQDDWNGKSAKNRLERLAEKIFNTESEGDPFVHVNNPTLLPKKHLNISDMYLNRVYNHVYVCYVYGKDILDGNCRNSETNKYFNNILTNLMVFIKKLASEKPQLSKNDLEI
jgi:hypothetical protein